MEIKNKNILVLGLGNSGNRIVDFLLKQNANIFLYDDNIDVLNNYIEKLHLKRYLSADDIDLVIISPGISKFHPVVKELIELKIPIISEIELAYNYSKGKLIAVTGTNGKTTTVTCIGEILKKYTDNYMVLGNIGIPYISRVDDMNNNTITCLEVSSFQLEFVNYFHPHISIILNLQPDHLDRYYNEDDYYTTKICICKNCSIQDYVILNYDDENVLRYEKLIKCKKVYISIKEKVYGAYYDDGYIVVNLDNFKCKISINNFKVVGEHNFYNIMASIISTYLLGIPINLIVDVINSFEGLPHRMQFIKELSGVKFINDSKATNIASCITAINSLKGDLHVLIGGSDKGEDFTNFFNQIDKLRNIKIYLFGGNKIKLYEVSKLCNFNKNIYMAVNLKEAVELAYKFSNSGDTILLSPACASFDNYKSYIDRGNDFINIVRSLDVKK